LRIWQEYVTASPPSHRMNDNDSNFRLQFGAMCSPSPESFFLMEIQITPVEQKKSP
jgi:hypothetical protein